MYEIYQYILHLISLYIHVLATYTEFHRQGHSSLYRHLYTDICIQTSDYSHLYTDICTGTCSSVHVYRHLYRHLYTDSCHIHLHTMSDTIRWPQWLLRD